MIRYLVKNIVTACLCILDIFLIANESWHLQSAFIPFKICPPDLGIRNASSFCLLSSLRFSCQLRAAFTQVSPAVIAVRPRSSRRTWHKRARRSLSKVGLLLGPRPPPRSNQMSELRNASLVFPNAAVASTSWLDVRFCEIAEITATVIEVAANYALWEPLLLEYNFSASFFFILQL